MNAVRVELLGPPRLLRGDEPVSADTRKATALLAYLAVSDRAHTRDALAELLWPTADPERGRGALRRTLSSLRTALPELTVAADRRTIAVEAGALVLDVRLFEETVAAARTHECAPSLDTTPATVPPTAASEPFTATSSPAGSNSSLARRLAPPPTPATAPHLAHRRRRCEDCLAALRDAVALHRGSFLEGFGLADAPAFDDWRTVIAERLRRLHVEALEWLVDGLAEQGDVSTALRHGQQLLELDTLHEATHQRLMSLHARAGDRAQAVEQYRTCVRALDADLGVEPLPETTALYLDIVEGRAGTSEAASRRATTERPPPARAAAASTAPPVHHDTYLPLVGRDQELDQLRGAYEAVGPHGALAVISGELAIGKTRLAEEAARTVRAAGGTVLSARCYEAEQDLAYASIATLLRGAVAAVADPPAPWLGEAARLLPDLHADPATSDLDRPGARTRFLEAVAGLLTRALAGSAEQRTPPGMLLVDDLHWADSASLDVLGYLARRLADRPLFLLVCWRTDMALANRRVRDLVTTVDAGATIVSPGRLDRAAVATLVSTVEGAREISPDRVHADTEGLPLLVVEYLAAVARGEGWTDEDALPTGVRELLGARLAAVSPTAARTVAAAAAIGRPFEVALLSEIDGQADEETVTALEELLATGLVRELGEHADYELAHPRLRDLALGQVSIARQRLLHRRAAEALTAQLAREPALAGRVAYHWQEAGRVAEAAEAHRLAAAHARSVGARSQALDHLDAALGLGHDRPAPLHREIGDLQLLAGAYNLALRAYETAAALADTGAELGELEHRLGVLHQRRGDWTLAASHLESAADLLGGAEPGRRARLAADRGLTAHRLGDPGRAHQLAREALRLAEDAHDAAALAQARNILGLLASAEGDEQAARTSFEHAAAVAEHADAGLRAAALNNLALSVARAGDPDRAIELAETAATLCVQLGDRHREAAVRGNLADLLHRAGREDDSRESLATAARLFTDVGEPGQWEPEIWKLVDW